MSVIWNRLQYVLSPQFDIYDTLKDVVSGRVADIGFGTGFGMHLLASRAHEVVGYEVDEEAIGFARRVFPFANMKFDYGDVSLGIHAKDFDYVVMVDVFEHLQNPTQAMGNVKGMLKNDGTAFISTPNRLSRYRQSANHYREYSPNEMMEVLSRKFSSVGLFNHALEPISSEYENPLIAVCR